MKKYGIYIRNPTRMPWFETEVEKIAAAEGKPLAMLFRIAFLEYWSQRYPSLKKKYDALKENSSPD